MVKSFYRSGTRVKTFFKKEEGLVAEAPRIEAKSKSKDKNKRNKQSLEVDFEWEKGAEIGRGSFGCVYKAVKKKTGEIMAVKEIPLSSNSETLDDTQQEIDLLSKLVSNKYIVKLLGYQTKDSILYIFMEFVEGGSIYSRMKTFGQLGELQVARYTKQIVQGLVYLHNNSILHGDLKCSRE